MLGIDVVVDGFVGCLLVGWLFCVVVLCGGCFECFGVGGGYLCWLFIGMVVCLVCDIVVWCVFYFGCGEGLWNWVEWEMGKVGIGIGGLGGVMMVVMWL